MNRKVRILLLLFVVSGAIAVGGWAVVRFEEIRSKQPDYVSAPVTAHAVDPEQWERAIERVKEERSEAERVAIETPPQLRHYDDRHWFLATQVAEVRKFDVHSCQDFVDLAAMLERGDLVVLPAVTDNYVLFGVGARANDEMFDRYPEDPKSAGDSNALQTLAKNFAGRSFNLDDPGDRLAMKVSMLSSLRPVAVKVLEELAEAYRQKFARPLLVSSLVRPEQYQHALNRVNRNAVLIDTPPHTTGLAFDIDYRYMSGAEQNFLMAELARLKDEGRIEVIRERSANYHVFVFIDGKRPTDDLIAASLEEATLSPPEANHPIKVPAKKAVARVERKSRTAQHTKTNARMKTAKSKAKRHR